MTNTINKKFSRCHISSEQVRTLTDGESAMGEGFWITLKNDDIGIVQNILLCGLGVGDEIRVRSGEEDAGEHPNEFVEVVKRNCNVVYLSYTYEGFNKDSKKLPKKVIEFIDSLKEHGILFEHALHGIACVQYPIDMSDAEFERLIGSGPLEYEA